jgi:ribosomal protein L24E
MYINIGEFVEKHGTVLFVEANEPQSYKEAIASPEKEKWLSAYQKEYDAQIKNKTWELVPLPLGRVALNCKIR